MFSGISIRKFREKFKSDQDCLQYILAKKLAGGCYCLKCQGNKYGKGREWHYLRCKKCGYDASATAGTLFHKCKLGMLKAFVMTFRVSVRKKGMSSCELSEEFGCQQRSAWLWKAKIQEAMKSSGKQALSGDVEVDEFLVGGFSAGEPGRSHSSKDLVILAIEKVRDKNDKITIGRAYCRVVNDASADSLKKIFDEHIAPQASIKTDGWRGYWLLVKDRNITKEKSDKGAGFPMLNIHIMNIKGWLRGVHHKCETHLLQQYLDEYHFRFNRRGFMNSIFDKLITKMTKTKPVFTK